MSDFSVLETLKHANELLVTEVAHAHGSDSPPIKAAASALRRSIRKTLKTPAMAIRASIVSHKMYSYDHSKPGQAPRKISGELQRAVQSGTVEGGRRVGFGWWLARILENGVNAKARASRPSKRKKGQMTKARRGMKIAPRPFMAQSLEKALPEMTDAYVSNISLEA